MALDVLDGSRASCRVFVRQNNNAFFFSSRRRHTRSKRDWSSDVCSSDLSIPRRHPPKFRAARVTRGTDRRAVRDRSLPPRLEYTAPPRGCDTAQLDSLRSGSKIGRASCRERVERSGVAVTLTKK